MKTTTFKTGFEIAEEIINSDIKNIHDALTLGGLATHGETIMMFVSENSDKFTKDICEKALLKSANRSNDWSILTTKQAWCVAFEAQNINSMYSDWSEKQIKSIMEEN